jgi:hypothetical protein
MAHRDCRDTGTGAICIEKLKYQIQHTSHDIFHALAGETDLSNPIQDIQESNRYRHF